MSLLLCNAQASIVSDACCLEIICATGYAESIVSSVPARLMILPDVQKEAKSEALDALIDKGLFHTDDINSEKEENFVLYFASKGFSNGEAACCAVVANRSWTLVSNEKMVVSAVQKINCRATSVSALEILHCWQDLTMVTPRMMADVLASVRGIAHYEPPTAHPLRDWWDDHLSISQK